MAPHVALASIEWLPSEFTEMQTLAAALRARGAEVSITPWDDPTVDWDGFDLVVIRTTWDYQWRYDEFTTWADGVGERLQNSPALVRWNTDKHYLADLANSGIPVVTTTFVEPGERPPSLEGEVVVKPAISAGARDTGRFGPATHADAYRLLAALAAEGRTALVQPYYTAVDTIGETAVVVIDGRASHALQKLALLRPDEVAPIRDDELKAAEVMYHPGLVKANRASAAQLAVAADVVAYLEERFGEVPLYARVDLVPGPDGEPVLIEVEAVEPNLFHDQVPESAGTFADAIICRATS